MSNRYNQLLSNTLLFSLSTFSSKLLVFFLLPLYTYVLSTESYGIVDMLVQTANLLLPMVSIGIMHAVIRFGIDKDYDSKQVFSGSAIVLLLGLCVFALLMPLSGLIDYIDGYELILFLYVTFALLRSLCSQFVRSQGHTRLYALDGLLSTVYTVSLNVIFLLVLQLDILGYMLAIIVADSMSCVFLLLTAKLYRFFALKSINGKLMKSMVRYSLPLIPTQIFWWITNVSDRFFVTAILGASQNGIYAAAYRIPTVISIFSTIFIEAWQLSAIGEKDAKDRKNFFTEVFTSLQSCCFVAAAGLIMLCKFVMSFLVDDKFFTAWQYIPALVIATVFSCLGSFMGSIYTVEKRSGATLLTMLAGAVTNIVLNLLLIPTFGLYGAAIATALSYVVVFVIRVVDTRAKLDYTKSLKLLVFNLLLVSVIASVVTLQLPCSAVVGWALTAALIAVNVRGLLSILKVVLKRGARSS